MPTFPTIQLNPWQVSLRCRFVILKVAKAASLKVWAAEVWFALAVLSFSVLSSSSGLASIIWGIISGFARLPLESQNASQMQYDSPTSVSRQTLQSWSLYCSFVSTLMLLLKGRFCTICHTSEPLRKYFFHFSNVNRRVSFSDLYHCESKIFINVWFGKSW